MINLSRQLLPLAISTLVLSSSAVGEQPKGATAVTKLTNSQVLNRYDFSDKQDFADASRGLIAATPDLVVKDPNGKVVWDMQVYRDFLRGDAPDTVNPSLWRRHCSTVKPVSMRSSKASIRCVDMT